MRRPRIFDIIVATQTIEDAKMKRLSGGNGRGGIVAFQAFTLRLHMCETRARVSISAFGDEESIEFWRCFELGTKPASRRAISLSAISLASGTVSGK